MVTEADKAAASRPERLPLSLSLGFGVGTVGVSCLLNPITVLFPAMLATVLGISPAVGGLLMTFAKVYDIGADIAIGAISDRTKSRWGRRRPYMFVGAIVGAAAFAAIFNPLFTSGHAVIFWLGAMLVIYSTGYSLFNIPYLAMPAEMTDDPKTRTNLLSYRTLFISIGQMISVPGAAALIAYIGRDAHGYSVMGWTIASIVIVTCLASVFATGKARRGERVEAAAKESFLSHARMAFENKPFVILMTTKMFVFLGLASTATTQLLFFLNVLGVGFSGQVSIGVANNLALAASLPIWVRIMHRIGKRRSYMIALALNGLLILTWLVPHVNANFAALMGRGVIAGFLSGSITLAGAAMLPDTMEWDRLRTGLRREGLFAGVYAIIEKAAFALAPAMILSLLSLCHYIPTKAGHIVQQPDSARMALYGTLVWGPAALNFIAATLLHFYPLDEAKLLQAQAEAAAA